MKHILSCLIFCFAALLPAAAQAQRAVSDVRTLNPTAVEVLYNDSGMLTIDFYGENIFRLFEDPNGGIIRNPEADPPAQILVDSPRLPVSVSLQRDGADYVLTTPAIQVRIAAASGLISVVRSADGTAVLEQVDPVKFEAGRTTLAFRAHSDEYFYGGGVQNGRFSHKGKSIAIENSNNWVDGGVASPTPFYWSTQGYGLLWHTFKPGPIRLWRDGRRPRRNLPQHRLSRRLPDVRQRARTAAFGLLSAHGSARTFAEIRFL